MQTRKIFMDEAEHFNARAPKYLTALSKWVLLAAGVGLVCGGVGAAFHHCVELATKFRISHGWMLFLLPVAGLAIIFLYSKAGYKQNHPGTNLVLSGVQKGDPVPLRMMPLIFVSTVITHLFGGSSGREGAALQIGGSIGHWLSGLCRLDDMNRRVMESCGMAAVFSALFGTPLTAAVFVLEVVEVGTMHYSALLPCLISSLVAYWVAGSTGIVPTAFSVQTPAVEPLTAVKVMVLAGICAMVSYLFCFVMHTADHFFQDALQNGYLRIAVGGGLVVVLSLLLGTRAYNGAGMDVISRAIEQGTLENPAAFLFKLLLTAITLGVGYKGGEIVPTFFVGACFGCLVGPLLGLPAGFAAAVGLLALFCGVVNCPMASISLGLELFGAPGLLLYALASATSYIVSGTCSLYTSQKLDYGKLEFEEYDVEWR